MSLRGFARDFARSFSASFAESYARSSGQMRDLLTSRPIAHRGLHTMPTGAGRVGPWSGGHRPENSLAAFAAAVEHGYAIECDLQMTRDGGVVVFHDRTLDRMTEASGRVIDHDMAELSGLCLRGCDEPIPLLRDLLDLVDGRVSLVLELKGEDADPDAFVAAVAEALRDYAGPVAIMSFLTPLTDRLREALPAVPRGLTAQGDERAFDAHMRAFERGDLHFASYDVAALPCRFTKTLRERQVPVVCWTVRTPEDVARSQAHADQMTFEGFLPQVAARDVVKP